MEKWQIEILKKIQSKYPKMTEKDVFTKSSEGNTILTGAAKIAVDNISMSEMVKK
jgi:hypothetical protein